MKGYTTIIPTMWFHSKSLQTMVSKYQDNKQIKEILIINNNNSKRLRFTENKVRIIGNGKNQFVNPSWNLGVKETKTEKIIIANDDIIIDKFHVLMEVVESCLIPGMIMGMDKSCYTSDNIWNLTKPVKMGHGFGTFMALYKKDYIEIPKEFKIWYGDVIQFTALAPLAISGVRVFTPMAGTTSKLNLRRERIQEKQAFLEYCK